MTLDELIEFAKQNELSGDTELITYRHGCEDGCCKPAYVSVSATIVAGKDEKPTRICLE